MTTLIYTPGASVIIESHREGIIDVSDDVSHGSLQLRQNASHTLSLTVENPMAKYDGVFAPNDRIGVQLKRFRWLQVFTGYLDSVPYFSAYPRAIKLSASCTRKVLVNWPWDRGSEKAYQIIHDPQRERDAQDGGLSGVVVKILTDVAMWPKERIHIGKIPSGWQEKFKTIYDAVTKDAEALEAILGTNPLLNGTLPGNTSGDNTISDPANVTNAALEALIFDPVDVEIAMATIRQLESTNNYTIQSTTSSASGAYQYVHDTWNGYGGYENAYQAPASVQDERARGDILQIYQKHGNKLMNIPRIWYYGESIMDRPAELDRVPGGAGNRHTIREYSYIWGRIYVTKYNESHGTNANSNSSTNTNTNTNTNTSTNTTTNTSTNTTTPTNGIFYPIPAGVQELDMDDCAWGGYSNGRIPASALSSGAHSGRGHPTAILAYEKMWEAANKEGVDIKGFHYRSYEEQADLHAGNPNGAAPAGRSNHGWGLACDITGLADGSSGGFRDKTYLWLQANAHKYGYGHPIWAREGANRQEIWHWEFFHYMAIVGQTGTPINGVNPFDSSTSTAGNIQGQIFEALRLWEGNWQAERDPLSDVLMGYKALLNDEPILATIDQLLNATGRKYCSAPNGDFIAWWPDYFGEYGLAGALDLKTIEMIDFTVRWTDEGMVTHQYVEGAINPNGQGPLPGGVRGALSPFLTQGICTVSMPGLLDSLINVPANEAGWTFLTSSQLFLKRFGARISRIQDNRIFGPHQEFWYAVSKFTEAWASMFFANVPMTFMPELFPGMLLRIPEFGVQFYIVGVDHSWSSGPEGYTTMATVSSPSALDGSGFFFLPKGRHVFGNT